MGRNVKLPIHGYDRPGTCWACGCDNASPRNFRLTDAEIIPTGRGLLLMGESVTLPIPLCEKHSTSLHVLPQWIRILSLPIATLLFILAITLPERFPDTSPDLLRLFGIGGMAASVLVFFVMRLWANSKQHFKLSTQLPKVVVVEFKDTALAEKIQREIEGNPTTADNGP